MDTRKKTSWKRTVGYICVLCLTLVLGTASRCDDGDDDFNHVPPEGQGAMIVDNNTNDDISVFINQNEVLETRDGHAGAYNLDPGIYNVVLIQQGGDHNFRGDIEILAGRLTILDVAFGDGVNYDILIFFQ